MTRSQFDRGDRGTRDSELAIELAGAQVTVAVTRSARRLRSVAIAVEAGRVKVAAPMAMTDAQLLALLAKRATWIAGRLGGGVAEVPSRVLRDGDTLPYRGEDLALRVSAHSGSRAFVRREGTALAVELPGSLPGERHPAAVRPSVAAWYRARAAEVLPGIVHRWAAVSGLVPARVLIRDQKRRWGSCGPDGTIRLNWRLVLFEPHLADYVVVHELAHLRHRHHQAGFWEEVARLMPDHAERRRQLTAAGRALVV